MSLRYAVLAAVLATAGTGLRTKHSRTVGPRVATGRIEGVVEISTALSSRRPQFRPYADPGTGVTPPPPPRDPIAAELRNVVIYIDGDSARVPAGSARWDAHRRAAMTQRDERFVPHIVPVVVGATVDFPNEDDLFHNVFSLSSAAGPNGFDLGRYPKGSSRSVTLTRVGTVQVFCHIHSDMSGVVLVLSNPFFAVPDESHRYVIDDVPEGEYTIVGWHERIKPVVRHVHVAAGQTSELDFNIPLPQSGGR